VVRSETTNRLSSTFRKEREQWELERGLDKAPGTIREEGLR
jgi:hypothetical protein